MFRGLQFKSYSTTVLRRSMTYGLLSVDSAQPPASPPASLKIAETDFTDLQALTATFNRPAACCLSATILFPLIQLGCFEP